MHSIKKDKKIKFLFERSKERAPQSLECFFNAYQEVKTKTELRSWELGTTQKLETLTWSAQWSKGGDKTCFDFLTFLGSFEHADIEILVFLVYASRVNFYRDFFLWRAKITSRKKRIEAVRGVLQTFPLLISDVTNGREVQIEST